MDTIKELEVVAWQDAEDPLNTTGEKRQMHGWATDGYPIIELVRKSDADARDAMRLERIKVLEADNQLWKNMHDFHKAELAGLKVEVVKGLVEALEAFDAAAKESTTIIGFAGKALKLLTNARKALATFRAAQGGK